ncbi:MAG TPA: phosphopyruvate hydratase [bacterium]
MTVTLRHVDGLEILDSRGNPTVQATVTLSDGTVGTAAAPSGASTGAFEAHELRDGDKSRYRGKGVLKAVGHVRGELAKCAIGRDASDQAGLDRAMAALDGTLTKARLGANAILAVSLANAVAMAQHAKLPLYRHLNQLAGKPALRIPLPMINLFSGGKHAGAQVDFQDFLIVPRGAASVVRAMEMTYAVHYAALDLLKDRHGYQPLVADEGGLAPRLPSNEAMLETAVAAIERAGLRPMEDVAIAIDVASSHFFHGGKYRLAVEQRDLSAAEMIERLDGWRRRYPILSIEDGLAEDDWTHWTQLAQALGPRCQVLGDDLFVTNPERIRRGIRDRAANSVLIKVNQIGTLTEALEAIAIARAANWTTVVSARSGETEDSWLADLATGTGAGQIKVGAITRSERLAKYNRLLAIAHEVPDLPFARDGLDRFVER